MTLKITLKPGEPVFIGSAEVRIITKSICTITIDGDAPVLRSDYAIGATDVTDTPSRLRLVLQRMYLTGDIKSHHTDYFVLAQKLLTESPAYMGWISETNALLIDGEIYQAVKLAKRYCTSELNAALPDEQARA